MTPRVSIVITTRNRCEDLRQTLESLGRTTHPPEMPVEILIVDNASTDGTAGVVKQCRVPGLAVRYLYEGRKGKTIALNSGIPSTTGQVILCTDDDVRVPEGWIEDMCGPILRGEVDALAGGVKIAPHLLRSWMKGVHQGWLAVSNESWLPPEIAMTGANMAFARKVLEKVPAFDPELGPGALGYSDDTLFSLQLHQAGYVIERRYEVVVEHWFDETRLKHSAWMDAARKRGRTKAYLAHHWYHADGGAVLPKLWMASLRMLKWSMAHKNGRADAEGCEEEELWLQRGVCFHKQLLIERRRPRAYAQRGTVKNQARTDANCLCRNV